MPQMPSSAVTSSQSPPLAPPPPPVMGTYRIAPAQSLRLPVRHSIPFLLHQHPMSGVCGHYMIPPPYSDQPPPYEQTESTPAAQPRRTDASATTSEPSGVARSVDVVLPNQEVVSGDDINHESARNSRESAEGSTSTSARQTAFSGPDVDCTESQLSSSYEQTTINPDVTCNMNLEANQGGLTQLQAISDDVMAAACVSEEERPQLTDDVTVGDVSGETSVERSSHLHLSSTSNTVCAESSETTCDLEPVQPVALRRHNTPPLLQSHTSCHKNVKALVQQFSDHITARKDVDSTLFVPDSGTSSG